MSAGLSADWWQRDRHLPQAQEEEEGDEQRHHGDAVTQEVYDHSYLVVHLAFLLQGDKKKTHTHTHTHRMSPLGASAEQKTTFKERLKILF